MRIPTTAAFFIFSLLVGAINYAAILHIARRKSNNILNAAQFAPGNAVFVFNRTRRVEF
jgi:hypothetical protein